MKKAILTTVMTLAFAMTAKATAKSEFWFQPAAGKGAFDMGLATTPMTVTTKNSGTTTDSKITSMPLAFKYHRGINDTMSWNFGSDYGTSETETSGSKTKEAGLGNMNVGVLANANEWYYGADASLSLTKKKDGSTTETGTRVTGGHTLTPFGGYHAADLGVGARVEYAYNMDRKKDESSGETTTSGGSMLSVTPYWETGYTKGLFGAKLAYAQVASEKSTGATVSDANGYTSMGLGAYVTHDLNENGTIVANIDMVSVPEFDYDSTTKVSASGTSMAVSYRMGF